MLEYVVRRLMFVPVTLAAITFLSFIALQLAPGDFFTQLQMNPQFDPATINELRVKFGLDQNWIMQYVKWLWRALHFDFGESIAFQVPVMHLIGSRFLSTVILSVVGLVVGWGIGIPLGVFVAVKKGTNFDHASSFVAFAGMSFPSFFIALLFLKFFGMTLGILPIGGTVSADYDSLTLLGKLFDRSHHLILPAMIFAVIGTGGTIRVMRAQVLEELRKEYVTVARSKGLAETVVLTKHILRNALNPFITSAGYVLAELISGAALLEIVLNLQGLGSMLLEAVQAQDFFVMMASITLTSFLLLVGNLLADIARGYVFPQIRYW